MAITPVQFWVPLMTQRVERVSKKFTDSSKLWVGSCDAGHVEQGQKRFVSNGRDHHIHRVCRVHDILEGVENGRHDGLTGD